MERKTEIKTGLVRTTLTGIFVAMAVAAAACNTMEGAGEDIEAGGDAVQDAADG